MKAELHIACTRPGLIRGGVAHPRHASYPLAHFTEAQLAEMLAEPELVLVLGARVTREMIPLVGSDATAAEEPPPPPPETPPESDGTAEVVLPPPPEMPPETDNGAAAPADTGAPAGGGKRGRK